jgi:hypothetical protein
MELVMAIPPKFCVYVQTFQQNWKTAISNIGKSPHNGRPNSRITITDGEGGETKICPKNFVSFIAEFLRLHSENLINDSGSFK